MQSARAWLDVLFGYRLSHFSRKTYCIADAYANSEEEESEENL